MTLEDVNIPTGPNFTSQTTIRNSQVNQLVGPRFLDNSPLFSRRSNLTNHNKAVANNQNTEPVHWQTVFSLYNVRNGLFLNGQILFTTFASNLALFILVMLIGSNFLIGVSHIGEVLNVNMFNKEYNDKLHQQYNISYPKNITYKHVLEGSTPSK